MCGDREQEVVCERAAEQQAGSDLAGADRAVPAAASVLSGWVGVPGRLLVLLVRGYQLGISPWLGRHCRFHPSCSQYFILSVQRYGAIRGGLRGIWRICRCHPWNAGGFDPP